MPESIDILLSTYNSELYVTELVNSIIEQTHKEWRLLIRDDGSTDNTIEKIGTFFDNFCDKVVFFRDTTNNLGVIKSFEYLLNRSTAEYIMFCDHDDIWLPEKIEITLKKMKETELDNPNKAILIHTDLKVVDNNLNEINSSFWKYSKLRPDILDNFNYLGICNGITGCTVMINKNAKEVSLPFSLNAQMHDSWIALCVSKSGGIIDYVNNTTILYRQHSFNTLGADKIPNLPLYILRKITNLKKTFKDNKKQISLLKELKYGSLLKYFVFKIKYFIKARI